MTKPMGIERITKGNWKRLLCLFVGHDKEISFAYPNTYWSCRRCGHKYFKEEKGKAW